MKRVVISGSYRRDLLGLEKLYDYLSSNGYEILSPRSLNFDQSVDGFVITDKEYLLNMREIELQHLTSILYADEIWLHLPGGYVGFSTSLEIGFAIAHQKRIVSLCKPTDPLLAQFVEVLNNK